MRQNSFLLNSKMIFLKNAQNEAEIGPFFNGELGKTFLDFTTILLIL